MRSLELFAGCGGLALGVARAGFKHALVAELDQHASLTLKSNKERGVEHIVDWPLFRGDVRQIDYSRHADRIDLLTGGPPCQPFSIGGTHRGPGDPRNMWREAIRAVREVQPKTFVFENVRGLLRPAFAQYLEYLCLQLAWPEVGITASTWRERLRLLRKHRARSKSGPDYHVIAQGINAADYGAPQRRHRAMIVGVRADVADEVEAVEPTHSLEALVWQQRVATTYWRRHGIPVRRPAPTRAELKVLPELKAAASKPVEKPWVTVRDVLADLPPPPLREGDIPNHIHHPGARLYERHTGSIWDLPAKALKAGDHGVPGGENTLVLRNGRVRYFTIREMARLQGFPDDFVISGSWKRPIKQLGNAVPVQVAFSFATHMKRVLSRT